MGAAKVSESDLEAVRKECDAQVQASERKVYALTKERDALKKGMEKVAVLNELLKEKDKDHEEVTLLLRCSTLAACIENRCHLMFWFSDAGRGSSIVS